MKAQALRMPTVMNMRITNRIKLDLIGRHYEVGGEEGEIYITNLIMPDVALSHDEVGGKRKLGEGTLI